jgi:CIC family chloride channel protein
VDEYSGVSSNPDPYNPIMELRRLLERFQHLPRRTRVILLTCFYGAAAGLATVGFQLGITAVYRYGLVALSRQSPAIFLAGSFAVIVGASLLVGWLLNSFCPEAAGSGIPQLKAAFWKDFGYVSWRVVWVKFVAGIVSIGGGCSLGREGPAVQLSGALASNLSGLAGEPKQNRRFGAATGAAAGLAAAFNTPLAAITFVLEEIIGDLNSRYLGGLLLASVIGAFMVHGILGRQPSFLMPSVEAPTWIGYALTPLVAALAAIVGVYFQRASIGLCGRSRRSTMLPAWARPALGGGITWVLGAGVFLTTGKLGVFALGYGDLSDALAGNIGWRIAGVLLVTKFIATFTCYGFGGCGGIFSPTLFFGGMTGVLVAGLFGWLWHLPQADLLTLAVVGMSATLGAVVRAPITGILIVFEMTHEFGLVPALMLGALVSQAISRRMLKHSFYDELLNQDGINLEHVQPPRDLRSWQQLPMSVIANFQPVVVRSLATSDLQALLKDFPYARFPVVDGEQVVGILSRNEAQLALKENRQPQLLPVVSGQPSQSVQDLQAKLIESGVGIVVLLDRPGGKILGLVTLHDLLRAQTAFAKDSDT